MWLGTLVVGGAVVLAGCVSGGPEGGGSSAPTAASMAADALPEGGMGAYLAAHSARLRDDVAGAADNLLTALKAAPGNQDVMRLAVVYAAADGRFDVAADVARALVKVRRGDMMAGYVLAVAAVRHGDWAAAGSALAPIPRGHLNALLGPLLRAWVDAGTGNAEGALAELKPLAGTAAFIPVQRFHTALLFDLLGRNAEAEAAYDQALAGDGGSSIHALQAAGRFFNRIGKPDKTRAIIDAYAEGHADSPIALALAADLVRHRNTASVVPGARSGMAEALFSVATSLSEAEAWEVTLALTRLALAAEPDLDLAWVLAADLYESHQDLEKANEAYARIPETSPVAFSVRLRIAKNLERLDRSDEAARCLNALADAHPDRPEALIELGDLYRGTESYADAVVAYDRAMARIKEIKPGHWVLFYTRGIALERARQWPRAEADFLKALELEPDQPLVMNYLGYSWLEQGRNLDRAQEMIEKAVTQRPRDGYIVDSLGWACYLRGNFAEAVRHLEQAVVLVADDTTINDHLGDAYARVGRTLEARYQWERALSLKPDDEQAGRIRAKLAGGPVAPTAAEAGKGGRP